MLRYQPARETLLSWLVRTGTREAVKLDRRARRDDELLDATDETHTVTLSIAECLDVLAAFEAIVDARLWEREAEILAAHVAAYTYAEIGLAKRLTPRTVERQLSRAKRKLRDARRLQQPDAATSAGERDRWLAC